MQRIPGHALVSEGGPRLVTTGTCARLACRISQETGDTCIRDPFTGTDGHARCECGAESVHLPSQKARQRWHRDVHKPQVAAQAGR
jgi:hypothetical protein